MKIHRDAAATRDHIEAVGQGTHFDRVTADVVAIQLHHAGHRLEISAVIALRRRNDHRIVLPPCAAKVRGRGNFQHITVPLMVVEDTRVGHTGRPRSEHAASIAAGNHKVTFRQRQRNVPRTQVVANAAKLGVVQLPRLHQLLPGRIRVAPIQLAPQHRLARRIGIEHVMEREILNMFARHLAHTRRPTAVAPGDQLNRWINCAHGSRKTVEFARTMRAVDPTIQLIAWGDSGWAARMGEVAGEQGQYLAFHHMFNPDSPRQPVLRGELYRRDPDATWEQLMKAWQLNDAKLRSIRDNLGARNIPLALTECHFVIPGRDRGGVLASWAAGVSYARILNNHQRHGDVLKIATAADFCGTRWQNNAVIIPTPKGNNRAYLQPVDRKSTRLNSSHPSTSYAVFCLKKKSICLGHGAYLLA